MELVFIVKLIALAVVGYFGYWVWARRYTRKVENPKQPVKPTPKEYMIPEDHWRPRLVAVGEHSAWNRGVSYTY
jgi:hypothetical protein